MLAHSMSVSKRFFVDLTLAAFRTFNKYYSLSLSLLNYAEACNQYWGPFRLIAPAGNTVALEEMSQR